MQLLQGTWTPNCEFAMWSDNADVIALLQALEFEPDGTRSLELLLPTTHGTRLLSPSLNTLSDQPEPQAISLERVTVEAAVFSPLSAVSFLSSFPTNSSHGIRFDESVIFWSEATKLILDFLAHGRFLPAMSRAGTDFYAAWQLAVVEENDRARLLLLAQNMPPVCRAFSGDPTGKLHSPNLLLESFIQAGIDALVGSFLRNSPLVPDATGFSRSASQSVVLQWLTALTSENRRILAPQYELALLHDRLQKWSELSSVAGAQKSPQLAFRLHSPPPPALFEDMDDVEPTWKLEFFLQDPIKPSNIIPAAQIWHDSSSGASSGNVELEDVLLEQLGKAAQRVVVLRRALEQPFPEFVELSTSESYQFLREDSVILQTGGYPVTLPHWWGSSKTKLGLHLDVQSSSLPAQAPTGRAFLGMNELLQYSWKVVVGDHQLSVEEFKALSEQQAPLVRIGQNWIELPKQQAASALKFLQEERTSKPMLVTDALRLGLGMANTAELPVVSFRAEGWIEQLLLTERQTAVKITPPDSFHGALRGYQQDGLSWLAFLDSAGVGGCLADDMGLGKTIQLLALLAYEQQNPEEEGLPTLLVVPMSILDNWEREVEKFAPDLSIYTHHGTLRATKATFQNAAARANIVMSTYSLIQRDEALFSSVRWGRIVLDEAQNIKNQNTKQTQAVHRLVRAQLSQTERKQPCRRVALTGTPLENHLDELWSIFEFLNPGFLGTLTEFRNRFSIPIERYRDAAASKALSQLIRPFVLRRLKSDPAVIDDLPEKIEMEEFTGLTSEQATLYERVLEDMLPQVDSASGIHRKGLVLSTITKLKQICDHPVLLLKDGTSLSGRSGKLSRLEQILEVILAEGDKVLIFTQYAQMGHLLKQQLQNTFGEEVLFLHGALNKKSRVHLVEQFQNNPKCRIFILSLKAGGFGLNLTAATQVIHYDQWWNPAVEEQATDRAYRIGQRRNVQVRKFICSGTLEERIAEMLQTKKTLASSIVGSTKSLLTELSTDDLRGLLSLSKTKSFTDVDSEEDA